MADEIEDAIDDSAKGPKRVRGDSGEVEQHPLKDQIAADRYLKSKAASQGSGLRLRRTKMIPPGATG